MGLYTLIEKRKKKEEDDQEYTVRMTDDFNDGMYRGYSQESKIMKESQIVKDINAGSDYRTSETTKVKVGKREDNNIEFIITETNSTDKDNLLNLPTYE